MSGGHTVCQRDRACVKGYVPTTYHVSEGHTVCQKKRPHGVQEMCYNIDTLNFVLGGINNGLNC